MKFVFSPDVMLCGWLGSKHQLTNWLTVMVVDSFTHCSLLATILSVTVFTGCFCAYVLQASHSHRMKLVSTWWMSSAMASTSPTAPSRSWWERVSLATPARSKSPAWGLQRAWPMRSMNSSLTPERLVSIHLAFLLGKKSSLCVWYCQIALCNAGSIL